MTHKISAQDRAFQMEFEACRFPAPQFGHPEHVRLAYIYLTTDSADVVCRTMRTSLLAFLASLGIRDGKYHETLTKAWVLGVRHFMEISSSCESSEEFLEANPRVRNSQIMLSHYSRDRLFSEAARSAFLEPDLLPIPQYAS